jgi:ribonuclease HI
VSPTYSALRPLDEALPGELDLEGWDSDDDRDNRGPDTCLSPSPVPERKKRKGQGKVFVGHAPFRPPATKAGSPSEELPTGPPAVVEVDGRTETKRNRSADPTSNEGPTGSKRARVSSALRHALGPPTHPQALRARVGASGDRGLTTASHKPRRCQNSTSDAAPLRRSTRRGERRAPGSTLGSPSDPQVLAEKEGAAEDGKQSTANPNEVRSFLFTPTEEDLIDEGTRTRSSSPPSSRSDLGPFSALRPFDDADPRELAGEGWDSDADWGFGGFEPCDSGMKGRDMGKPRRQKDSAAAAAPLRRSERQRDPGTLGSIPRLPSDSPDRGVKEGANGVGGQGAASTTVARPLSPIPADRSLGGRKRPLPASPSPSNGGHQPCASPSHPVRSRRGKRESLPRACRQGINEVGLVWRTVDPSLLDDATLTGDTSLSLGQVVFCLRRMLTMVPPGQDLGPETSPPWQADWFSSAELGFPLVADQYHRDAHPLIRQYVCSQIGAGDLTLGSLLRFRGGIGNDHCEICDHSTGRGSLIICDQCECTYHEECLEELTPKAGEAFICPKCRDTLVEVMDRRLNHPRPLPPWERYSIPLRMLDPKVFPECQLQGRSLAAVLTSPPTGGYVAILKDPIESVIQWHDVQIFTSEGVSTSSDFHHPFQIEGARWHLLRTLAGPRLGTELVPFISREAQLQRGIDATGKRHCIAWGVLSAARDLYNATHYLGGTAVTAPPFFDAAVRSDTLFWHSDPTRMSEYPVDSPLVMALADFTDKDFEENYAPHLQRRQDWVILTPPLPHGTKKQAFLEQYGRKIATGQGKVYRERGWWMSGRDALASHATPLEGWVSKGQTPDAKRVSVLTGALQNTAAHDPPFFDSSKTAQLFREGTEMGLLGLHSSGSHVYATDGSLEGGHMGAGVYIVRSGKALRCRVGRSRESRTSLRVETGASYLALEHGRDIAAPIYILTDSANHLQELEDWVGPGKYPTLHSSKDGDIVRGMLELLHHRVTLGFPTIFVKVRAHRGEPYNEAADRIASTATRDEDVPLLWNAPSGRIIYQFAPDESNPEDDLYSASMNDTVKKFIKNQAATSTLYSSPTQGFTESFLRRLHSSRDLLGACLADSSFPDGAKKRLIQSVSLQFPCRALLHQWGKEDSPNCPHCNERESLGHIQSRCKILEKPRITAHHMIWREILLQLFSLSGDEGDEHKWVIPSAVSADSHKELTVRQIIQHFGFFASDAALEDKILTFFAQRATLALAKARHFQDPTDPTSLALDTEGHADFLAQLRFSTHTLTDNQVRRLNDQELQTSLSAFLDLRPDGFAVHQKSKRAAILEFTRAMDSSVDWEEKKDAEKRARYAPVLDFFNSLSENLGWKLIQFNFTVGVRGSISNVDRTEPLSFLSTLRALGITSKANLEKIRKVTAKRAFEAHDLLLRSYYAAKSSPSRTDFSAITGNTFALQHRLRPPKLRSR